MKIKWISVFACSLLLAACSSNETVTQRSESIPDCVFADGSNQPAPQWVCGAPVNDVALSAVGYADKTAAGPNFMRQMAATAARTELAQVLSLQLQNMVKQYAETTGVGDSESVDRMNSVVTKQITDQTLVGSRVIRQMPTPTGGMVVLVGLDPKQTERVSEDILRTSMKNHAALFQKMEAKKSFDELASDIAKQNTNQ